MKWWELENLLDKLKGEEAVFDLYKKGKALQIQEIYGIFKNTRVFAVNTLEEALSSAHPRKKVLGVFGERGMGKSTLVSTSILNHYLQGNYDEIIYLRYDRNSEQFVPLLSESKEEGVRKRGIVVDDIHYFMPKLIRTFQKGSIDFFDKFLLTLNRINKLRAQRNIDSTLIYISDIHSFDALYGVYKKLLFQVGREDLLDLLPTTKKQINVNEEFYGKTYALLRGDKRLYNIATILGESLTQETGILANTPRALKWLIKVLQRYREQIKWRLLEDKELLKRTFVGDAILDTEKIHADYEEKFRTIYYNFWKQLSDIFMEIKMDLNTLRKEKEALVSKIQEQELHLSKFPEKVEVEILYSESGLNFNDWWEEIAKEVKFSSNKISNYVSESKEQVMNLSGMISSLKQKLGRVIGDMKKKNAEIKKLVERTGRQVDILLDNFNFFLNLKPNDLKKANKTHQKIYKNVKLEMQNLVSQAPELFSLTDVKEVRELIENPSEILKNVNKNSILLLLERDLLPY